MGRAKQSMKLVREGRIRNITFRKRKEGLKKKAHELSVLCDVEVCLIIYGHAMEGSTTRDLEIWPPNRDDVQSLIDSYKNQSSEDQTKNTDNLFKFLEKKRQNIENDLLNLRKENKIAKYVTWDDRYNNFSFEQLRELGSLLDVKLANARNKIDAIKSAQTYASSLQLMNDFVPPQHQSSSSFFSPLQIAHPSNYYNFPQTRGQIAENLITNDPLLMMKNSDSYCNTTSQLGGMTSNNLPCISRYSVDTTTLGNFSGLHPGYLGCNDPDMLMIPPFMQSMKMEDNLAWYDQIMKNTNRNEI